MADSPPPGPQPPEPEINDIWIDNKGEALYWDGNAWVPYEDPPAWPGKDPDPKWLEREP